MGYPDANKCYWALTALNPAYVSLLMTLCPSWVHFPFTYSAGSVFSLMFAFKDPDSSSLRTLLSDHHLFLFRVQGIMKKWKQKPPFTKAPFKPVPLSFSSGVCGPLLDMPPLLFYFTDFSDFSVVFLFQFLISIFCSLFVFPHLL
jgi:hypothetical protein